MIQTLGVLSYGLAAVAFVILTILLIFSWRGCLQGGLLAMAAALSALWAMVSAAFEYAPESGLWLFSLMNASEALRDIAWIGLLLLLNRAPGKDSGLRIYLRPVFLAVMAAIALILIFLVIRMGYPQGWVEDARSLSLFVAMSSAILGLTLVEHFFRITPAESRPVIKYICFGVGGLFAYDFFLYSEALLYGQVAPSLWAARGVVNAMVVPLIAVSAARNPNWSIDIHVSRRVVYHSTTFVGAGIYLLLMAGGGYYIRYLGGSVGGVAQAVFMFVATLALLALILSDRIRAHIKVFISKHFYNYRYDYREEWLGFTRTLSDSGAGVALNERIVLAMAAIVDSDGGALWIDDGGGTFVLRACHALAFDGEFEDIQRGDSLLAFMGRTGWIIDVNGFVDAPEHYEGLALREDLIRDQWAWLLMPLIHDGSLLAVVAIKQAKTRHKINWEDCDILKTAGQQAAMHLVQAESARALVDARQFEAFNQLSAFMIHDLKNLVSQLSMILQNAQHHSHNPEFVKDMIATVDNSVERMNGLLLKLKTGWAEPDMALDVDLTGLVHEVVAMKASTSLPVPRVRAAAQGLHARVDRERLVMVLSHVIQNAQDATPDGGSVVLALWGEGEDAMIEVRDTGTGMDGAFIRDRLFRPFASTKGRGNMGIGVYEARHFLRQQGGDLMVWSRQGEGACFTLRVPLVLPRPTPADAGASANLDGTRV